jgi:hypothetical protein
MVDSTDTTAEPRSTGNDKKSDRTTTTRSLDSSVVDAERGAYVAGQNTESVSAKDAGNPRQTCGPPVPGGSFTIREWCAFRRMSHSMFYKMQREGWGPKTMSVGGRQYISTEADDTWRREREAATEAGFRRGIPKEGLE